MNFTYTYHDTTYTVELERLPDGTYSATIGDSHYTVTADALANGAWLIADANTGDQHTAHVTAQDEQRFVHVDGVHYTFTVPDTRTARRRGSAGGGGELTAQMPGQVTAVQVANGDSVTAGQTLVVLEAMKMEIRVSAPADGMVKAVHVAVGDVVERGQVLVELEAES